MSRTPPTTAPHEQPVRRRGNRLYLTIWSLLGLGAGGYLVMLALGQHIPVGTFAEWDNERSSDTSVSLRKSAAVTPLATGSRSGAPKIAGMRQDIEALKSHVNRVTAAQNETRERVARLEAWQNVVVQDNRSVQGSIRTGDASTDNANVVEISAQQPDPGAASEIEGTTLDGVTRTAEPVGVASNTATTSDDAAILASLLGDNTDADAVVGVVTEPVAPQLAPTASLPIPGRRTFGVELGSGDSVDSLRLTWALLNERHRDLIGSLAPRVVQTGSGVSEIYRLIAGPFKSSRQAGELCTQLQAYYITCQTSAFTGSVL